MLLARTEHLVRAVEYLGMAKAHPAVEYKTVHQRIVPLLEELRDRIPSSDFASALARGGALQLQDIDISELNPCVSLRVVLGYRWHVSRLMPGWLPKHFRAHGHRTADSHLEA